MDEYRYTPIKEPDYIKLGRFLNDTLELYLTYLKYQSLTHKPTTEALNISAEELEMLNVWLTVNQKIIDKISGHEDSEEL